jgi:hypothetical protein
MLMLHSEQFVSVCCQQLIRLAARNLHGHKEIEQNMDE